MLPMIGNLFFNTPNALSIALRNDACRKLNNFLAFWGDGWSIILRVKLRYSSLGQVR